MKRFDAGLPPRRRRWGWRHAGLLLIVLAAATRLVASFDAPGPVAAAQGGTAADRWISSALEDLSRGNTEAAAGKLRLARWADASDTEATMLLAWVHASGGDWEQASALVAALPQDDAGSAVRVAAEGLRGLAQEAMGQTEAAVESYRRLLALVQDSSAAHLRLGAIAALAARDPEGARPISAAWGPQAPRTAAEWRTQAEEHFRQVLARSPEELSAYALLGELLIEQGRLREAGDVLRAGNRVDHRVGRLHYLLGLVLEHEGDREGAISEFRRALELEPGYLPARTHLDRLSTPAPPAGK